VGTYLVPRLVVRGHRLAEEQAGSFGARVRGLQPDVVIDLICFEAIAAS
jgi:hypothetical protein